MRDSGRSDAKKFVTNRNKNFRCIFNLSLRTLYFYQTVCYHARDKQIGLPLRGRSILLSRVWLRTELGSTQSFNHYLLCTQRIKSDLRSAREIWTALILWKINLRAVKSWFDSPLSEKAKVPPPTISLLFSPPKCSFRCLSFSLSKRLNFPLVC